MPAIALTLELEMAMDPFVKDLFAHIWNFVKTHFVLVLILMTHDLIIAIEKNINFEKI